jgi:hypothetical protein
MRVLVDTSVWIDYFRTGENSQALDHLLDADAVVVNDLVLTELIPFLRLRKQPAVIKLLNKLPQRPLTIDWQEIREFQFRCLKAGINGVGIPDLLIVQNARQSECGIFSLDSHFKKMRDIFELEIYHP